MNNSFYLILWKCPNSVQLQDNQPTWTVLTHSLNFWNSLQTTSVFLLNLHQRKIKTGCKLHNKLVFSLVRQTSEYLRLFVDPDQLFVMWGSVKCDVINWMHPNRIPEKLIGTRKLPGVEWVQYLAYFRIFSSSPWRFKILQMSQ